MKLSPKTEPRSWLPVNSLAAGVWIVLLLGMALLVGWVFHFDYLPDDDALRHAAKAISGKRWSEILVLRTDITIDHNPGWHFLLRCFFLATHCTAQTLVLWSVAVLFLVVVLIPCITFRRPEAWLLSIAALSCLFPYLPERLFLGRPLLLTITVAVLVLARWSSPAPLSRKILAFTTALIALATWVHGSWYLSVLLPAAFLAVGQFRKAILLGLCWLAGSFLGACCTGQPFTFLIESARIPLLALGKEVSPEILVGEFVPYSGSWPALVLVGAMIGIRIWKGQSVARACRDPILALAVIGCLLGFRVARFWLDWGLPALALGFARELEPVLERFSVTGPRRLSVVLGVACFSLVAVGGNWNERWTRLKFECLDARNPEIADWLPAPGGILYAVEPSVFYHTFYCNPLGRWQYILGFEATFMRPEDFQVYATLCRTRNAVVACGPWVNRMRPEDRLIFSGSPQVRPAFARLEWRYIANYTWAGRLPR